MAAERPDKKEKKDKKRSEESGVAKPKKEKKEKKDKKERLAAALDEKLQQDAAAQSKPVKEEEDSEMEDQSPSELPPLARTVVPFAVPLADDKGMKKVYKAIKKAAKNGTLKRGVKEVVKTLRKSPAGGPGNTSFPGVVVIAGDISPQDVISHIPVLCEDHNVPFIFVTSRAELGAAAKTKRPTSVVMIMEKPDGKKKAGVKEEKEEDDESFGETYASLVKLVQKEFSKQSFWTKGESKA
ncbi:ribosomal protein L7Ae/L30e/S12e/Gadd45 [Metarhizium robertsii]|uniref:Ribosomal protein L7Ae/L30e/S12e/Gadd45 n=2 Tax=Metarhizium robertsii TaxID=568076 RepID=E9ER92_METRA|nr:Ribosomal protein L7Ae/L30e/S12e/Gadd45 [Metarhizium robertsii ARSEF 23]EFZ01905.1 Ribosomal protein L7Ae/L30e/S12e/Gadd45 [Metarhizium robertsii ARSEF 23]EXV02402.1 ribosomal protein L7Ae/L30e/S12e/Gadd45 [Metarhizium robertsii]